VTAATAQRIFWHALAVAFGVGFMLGFIIGALT
jgi:hypothetical protein